MTRWKKRIGIAAGGAACLAAILLRAVFIGLRRGTFDLESWRTVVAILRQGKELYLETSHYNYSPLWAAILVGLDAFSRVVRVSFPLLLALFFLAVDLATAGLLREIALRKGKTRIQAFLIALLFFANPVSVITSSYLNTFDNLSIAFLLLAVLSLKRSESRPGAAAIWLSLSLLVKHITWFHPLLFARRGNGARISRLAALTPYALFLLAFLPFWKQWPGIRAHVFQYRFVEDYGIQVFRYVSWLPKGTATVLFVLAVLGAVLLARGELDRGCLRLFLVILIFTPGIWVYYFVWPIALGALFPSLGYLVYTLVIAAFFLKSPDVLGLDWPHLPGWWGCWWATVFWFLWELRSVPGSQPTEIRRRLQS